MAEPLLSVRNLTTVFNGQRSRGMVPRSPTPIKTIVSALGSSDSTMRRKFRRTIGPGIDRNTSFEPAATKAISKWPSTRGIWPARTSAFPAGGAARLR